MSSAGALVAAIGAEYVLFADATADFACLGVQDGDLLELAIVGANVLHTQPWVMTGHTLMVVDFGRTRLASSAEDGARALPRSMQVFQSPAKVSGGAAGRLFRLGCGRKLSSKPTSTIGFEAHHTTAFGIPVEAEVLRVMTAGMPAPPPEAARTWPINAGRVALA